MADTYSWAASVTGGGWQQASNWIDTTTGTTATTPPNASNAATVSGAAGTNFQILTGPGTAASLLLLGNTAFEGQFAAASVTIGSTIASLDVAAIDLESNTPLVDAGTIDLLADLELDGTKAALTSPLLAESNGGTLYVVNGADLFATTATIGGYLFVDPLGIAEIGTLGTALSGSLTVDPGVTATLSDGADIGVDVGLAGSLAVTGAADIAGNVTGTGAIAIAGTANLDVFGSIAGLASITDADILSDDGTVANVGLITLGSQATATFDGLANVGTVQIGAGGNVSVDQNITAVDAIEVGATAGLQLGGTLSGPGRIDVANAGSVVLTAPFGTLAPQDVDVPINLAGSNELLIDSGVSIGGLVSGFTTSDLIAVAGIESDPDLLITGASLAAGGTLLLSDDGTVTNAIAISATGQYLTNAVGLATPLPTGGSFSAAGTTDIVLASGTTTGLASSGSVTVTGALGFNFQVLAGTGTATGLTFIDNTALEGSFTAAQVDITAGTADAAALDALDLQPGATLTATAGATISSNAEIDGPGARFAVAGPLDLAGGELLVVNGGTVQATALTLDGTGGGATLDVDQAGAIVIGNPADARSGALLIDTGATLAELGSNTIIGTVVDQGTMNLGSDGAFVTVFGNLSGSGVVAAGTGSLFDIEGSVAGLTGLTVGANADLTVAGSMTGLGSVSIGSIGLADLDGAVSGSGSFAVGALGQVSIGGLFTGFSQASLGASATLSLGGGAGSTDTVPILLAGTADIIDMDAGLDIGGTVSGFTVGDLIAVIESGLESPTLVTGASLGGGILTLTTDGTVADLVAMAGNAGQQFLTNAVGSAGLSATDIVLPSATLSAIGAGGSVTGASGAAFDVLTGAGSSAALTFLGNLALEGSYSATGTATIGSSKAAVSALDIEAAATLSAASLQVGGGLEVDGAGASLITRGTLALGGNSGTQLLAANSGVIQAAAIVLAGTTGSGADLAVDPTARIEVGTLGLGAAGTLTIDAGSTLAATAAASTIEATIADNGLLTAGSGDLTITDDLLGSGTLALGTGVTGELQGIAGLAAITVGNTANLVADGDVTGVGTLTEAAGAAVELDGSVATSGGITVGPTADLTIDGDLSGSGTLSIGAGATAFLEGTVSGLSQIVIGAGAMLELDADDLAVPIVMGPDSTLAIDPSATITGVIEGFASGDAIAVSGAPSTIVTAAGLAAPGSSSLLLTDDGTIINSLTVAGTFGLQQFLTNVVGSGFDAKTDVTLATPCFAAGSAIATARGRVAVEALRVGDAVQVMSGGTRPVVWIGHRRIDCRRHPQPEQVWPVQVRAHAFAPGQPGRDLRLSPDHAVFADGVLIPVKHLINGRTIRQIRVDAVTYFHVELDRHDVLLAEALAVESYLDTGNRAAFANGGAAVHLHPDFAPLSWQDACAELVQDGARLQDVKQRLFARAGAASRPALGLQIRAGGRDLAPDIIGPDRWRVAVPPRARLLHLHSPRWMPAACEAASLDRRSLGVRLFGAAVDGLACPLDGPLFGPGFHPVEATAEGPCRWTDGRARLLLPPRARIVTLRVGDAAAAMPGPVSAAA